MVREFIDKVKAKGIIASGKDDKAYFGSTSNDWKVIDFLNEVPTVTEQEIVKPYLEKIKKQIIEESEFAYANFEEYKDEVLGVESDELPDDDFRYGLERAVDIINEFLSEQEKEK